MAIEATCAGATVALVGKHGKELALAPVFARLGLRIDPVSSIDTDAFGTFVGDIPRRAGPRETVIAKARAGLALGARFVMASEGTFGPDPVTPLIARAIEHLALVDAEIDRVIVERVVSHRTNFASCETPSPQEARRFLAAVGFPGHAVVVRARSWSRGQRVSTGVSDMSAFVMAFEDHAAADPAGVVRIDTDMRAHMNPTRRREIRRVGAALARRVSRRCPACRGVGFGETSALPGLPCEACGAPTALLLGTRRTCDLCSYSEILPRGDGRSRAPLQSCEACNP